MTRARQPKRSPVQWYTDGSLGLVCGCCYAHAPTPGWQRLTRRAATDRTVRWSTGARLCDGYAWCSRVLGQVSALLLVVLVACVPEYGLHESALPVDTGGPPWEHHWCECGPYAWDVCYLGRQGAERIAETWADGYACQCMPVAPECAP